MRLPSLTDAVVDNDQTSNWVCPPPAEAGVEQQAEEDGCGQIGVYQRDERRPRPIEAIGPRVGSPIGSGVVAAALTTDDRIRPT
jgi:hypothetical protein